MRKVVVASIVLTLAGGIMTAQRRRTPARDSLLEGIASGRTRIVDLTYALNDKLPKWPGDARVFEARSNATVERNGYFTRSIWMLEHYGTHLDAPAHFPPGKEAVDQLAPQRLFGSAVVIDVIDNVKDDADYRLTTRRIERWEREHGRIPQGGIVLLRTGWARRWSDEARYRNEGRAGRMRFPGYSVEAVKLLIDRGVVGLGIDTLSVDYGRSENFEVHKLSHGAGLYHLENLADMSALPESGAYLVVAPIKLEGGSGGAVRVFALLP
ncbi:MAG: cyclase family protein [Candidatus Acidiferrales bacterium]